MIDRTDLSAKPESSIWLRCFLTALETRKRLGMTESQRTEFLEMLTSVVGKYAGAEKDRIDEQIGILRDWASITPE